jgi:hypothetical protein
MLVESYASRAKYVCIGSQIFAAVHPRFCGSTSAFMRQYIRVFAAVHPHLCGSTSAFMRQYIRIYAAVHPHKYNSLWH